MIGKKYIQLSIIYTLVAIFLSACSTTSPGNSDTSTLGNEENATINGANGEVYSGGDSYNPGAAAGYNAATNGKFFNDPQYGVNVVGGPSSPAKDRVIYFPYDSSYFDSRAQSIVVAHANYLKSNKSIRIILEGHTDSRGSRGYNISLGEKRAISVLKALTELGVAASQIRIISYGEENPAAHGFTESDYQQNRRVVIQYAGNN